MTKEKIDIWKEFDSLSRFSDGRLVSATVLTAMILMAEKIEEQTIQRAFNQHGIDMKRLYAHPEKAQPKK